MGQLPKDRLTPYIRPFTYTGIDYFGPYYITIGRRREKRWVALFTCLTIRAVHLELAVDLSSDACILCIRNFVNIRGVPLRIRSDNGTNFVAANKELKADASLFVWDNDAIEAELANRGIQWLFNCPLNPSAGGCWERLVQSIKKILIYTLKTEAPRLETFRSLIIEAANMVNTRPLTHLPVFCSEDEPLTPNHFLLGTVNSVAIPIIEENTYCRKQWRILQQLKSKLWKRWIHEYLPTITRRTKWCKRVLPIKVDDLVIICEDGQYSGMWRRGRVVKVNVGADGQVRTAEVKTSNGILRRPASKLAVLDVETGNNNNVGDGESSEALAIHGGGNVADENVKRDGQGVGLSVVLSVVTNAPQKIDMLCDK